MYIYDELAAAQRRCLRGGYGAEKLHHLSVLGGLRVADFLSAKFKVAWNHQPAIVIQGYI